jgi:hypothetical protein
MYDVADRGPVFEEALVPVPEHDPEKHGLGGDPRAEAVFPKVRSTAVLTMQLHPAAVRSNALTGN